MSRACAVMTFETICSTFERMRLICIHNIQIMLNTWVIFHQITFSVWAWLVQNMISFTAKQAEGLACWRHNDGHEGMPTSSFCYLMGTKNTQTRVSTMPRCLFVCWEMDVKGKTEKRQRLNLSTQSWAFVSDWWSKKFRHADLTVFWRKRLSLSIHWEEIHLASPSFTLLSSLHFSHFCLLGSIS